MKRVDDTESAFQFYESIRHRLPTAGFTTESRHATSLLELADRFDAFVFDAFGVLNVGMTEIAGAAAVVGQLRQLGKQLFVLTNGSTMIHADSHAKLLNMGFDFSADEIISSRQAAERALQLHNDENHLWGAITGGKSAPSMLPVDALELADDPTDYQRVDAFVFLSSWGWTRERQEVLRQALADHPRPLVVANPDVVAPFETGFSLEPGYFAHSILDGQAADVAFYGKPYPEVYALLAERIEVKESRRIAMLGDTLHTDVLGAAAAGWSTILVTHDGLFRHHDFASYVSRSGIVPDWVIPSMAGIA